MKNKTETLGTGVQELCRKLKMQLDELSVVIERRPSEAELRRKALMEQLKRQLSDLSR